MTVKMMKEIEGNNRENIRKWEAGRQAKHERNRSKALPQIHVWRNARNENKYIETVHYACGNYYAVQFMQWGIIRNNLGSRTGRRHRFTVRTLNDILQDYIRLY